MAKVWAISFIGFLVVAVIVIALTLTFVKFDKKDKEEKAISEILWAFHLDIADDSKLKGVIEDVMNADILKTAEYTAGGNKATVANVTHDFDGVKVNGYTHTFEHPLRLKKVVVDKTEIVVAKLVALAGFTVFHKEGTADFVTIWHDDEFHHYSPTGELKSKGAFPFADGDMSKHPDVLKLPKLYDVTKVFVPEPAKEVVKPKEEVKPPTDLREGALIFDLDVITKVYVGMSREISMGQETVTVEKKYFDSFYKIFKFTFKNQLIFAPYIKFSGSYFDLKCDKVNEFDLYVGESDQPILIRLSDNGRVKNFSHKGVNVWESLVTPTVSVEVLDDVNCKLNDLVIFDFSKHDGIYKVGDLEVQVTQTEVEPFERFKSFKHTVYKSTGFTKQSVSFKVHKFKFFRIIYLGLPRNEPVEAVTAFFWAHDLTKPLLFRLMNGDVTKDYLGFKDYSYESNSSLVKDRLENLNYQVNHAVVINLGKHDSYDYMGGTLQNYVKKDVIVRVFENTPINFFRKTVHTHSLGSDVFHITRFVGDTFDVNIKNVHAVEAFYLYGHSQRPLMYIIKEAGQDSIFMFENDRFVKKHSIIYNMDYTVKHLAYHVYRYLTCDLLKFIPYHFTGEPYPDSSVVVRRDTSMNGFVKTTHTLEIVFNQTTPFHLLQLRGVDIRFTDKRLNSVVAYFCTKHLNEPLVVVLKGDQERIYIQTEKGFVSGNPGFFSDLENHMKRIAHIRLGTIFLKLDLKANYYNLEHDGLEVKVRKQDSNLVNYEIFVHEFKETKDVRFTVGQLSYFDPILEPQFGFVKASVTLGEKDFPVYVTLFDTKNKDYRLRYDGDKRWKIADLNNLDSDLENAKTKFKDECDTLTKQKQERDRIENENLEKKIKIDLASLENKFNEDKENLTKKHERELNDASEADKNDVRQRHESELKNLENSYNAEKANLENTHRIQREKLKEKQDAEKVVFF